MRSRKTKRKVMTKPPSPQPSPARGEGDLETGEKLRTSKDQQRSGLSAPSPSTGEQPCQVARRFSHGCVLFKMALRIVNSLRMQAVMATLNGLPLVISRSNICAITGFQRL